MSKSLRDLLPIILAKTKERKIPWKAEGETIFFAEIAPNRTIVTYEDALGLTKFVSLRGQDSVELESVSVNFSDDPNKDLISKIYEFARRQSLGIDTAIEDLENTLLKL